MTWEDTVDTFLKIIVLAFIGTLIWLHLRDEDNARCALIQATFCGPSVLRLRLTSLARISHRADPEVEEWRS